MSWTRQTCNERSSRWVEEMLGQLLWLSGALGQSGTLEMVNNTHLTCRVGGVEMSSILQPSRWSLGLQRFESWSGASCGAIHSQPGPFLVHDARGTNHSCGIAALIRMLFFEETFGMAVSWWASCRTEVWHVLAIKLLERAGNSKKWGTPRLSPDWDGPFFVLPLYSNK